MGLLSSCLVDLELDFSSQAGRHRVKESEEILVRIKAKSFLLLVPIVALDRPLLPATATETDFSNDTVLEGRAVDVMWHLEFEDVLVPHMPSQVSAVVPKR
jgi:hypothetical protein